MKTKKLFSACFISVIAIFFASCSSSIDIVKRQYNDGYYIHVSKNKPVAGKSEIAFENKKSNSVPVTQEETIIAENKTINEDVAVKDQNGNAPETMVASSDNKPTLAKKNNLFANDTEPKSAGIKSDFGFKNHFSNSKKENELLHRYSSNGSDVPEVVLILLCIFLPFIAVGLVDNWGTKFLIDLLLCLLFYIPGIIYAFIVCFG